MAEVLMILEGLAICPASLAWIFNEHLNHLRRSVMHYDHHDIHLENVSLVPVCCKCCLLTLCWNDRKNKWEKRTQFLEQKGENIIRRLFIFISVALIAFFCCFTSVCAFFRSITWSKFLFQVLNSIGRIYLPWPLH